MSLKRYSLVLAGFLIIALGAIVAPVSANTITIDNDSPTALSYNITHNVNTGDTLILNPGTYFENNIAIPSSITSLTIEANTSASAGGSPANTIIDAQMDGIIFSVSSSTTYLTIDNLTLKDGSASGNGGAIDSLSSGTLAVTSSTFTNCTGTGSSSSLGGAIYVKTGTVTLTSSNFTSLLGIPGRRDLYRDRHRYADLRQFHRLQGHFFWWRWRRNRNLWHRDAYHNLVQFHQLRGHFQ